MGTNIGELDQKYFVKNKTLAEIYHTDFQVFEVFAIYTQVYRQEWEGKPIRFWRQRLTEETQELSDAMNSKHHHLPEKERLQLAATHSNLLFDLARENLNVRGGPRPDEVDSMSLARICCTNNQYRLGVYQLILNRLTRPHLSNDREKTLQAGKELIDNIPNRRPETKNDLATFRRKTIVYVATLLHQIIEAKRPFDSFWYMHGGTPYGVPTWQFLRFQQSVVDSPEKSFERLFHEAFVNSGKRDTQKVT